MRRAGRVYLALTLVLALMLALTLAGCAGEAGGMTDGEAETFFGKDDDTGEDKDGDRDTDKDTDIDTDKDTDRDPDRDAGGEDDIARSLREKLFLPLAAVALALAGLCLYLLHDRNKSKSGAVAAAPVPARPGPEDAGARPMDGATVRPANYSYGVGNLHNIGKRDEQQDSFCVSDIRDSVSTAQKGLMAVVADGMGGLQGGAAISQRVTDTFLNGYRTMAIPDPGAFLAECTVRAQSAVREYIETMDVRGGSTLVSVLIRDGQLNFLSVGDSRIYLLRNGQLAKLNHEHNFAAVLREQAARGDVDPREPYVNPRKDALTSYIGIERLRLIDRSPAPMKLLPGDRVMLCSDGVYNALGDERLTALLAAPAAEAASNIEAEILRQDLQRQDNFTAVIIDFGGAV